MIIFDFVIIGSGPIGLSILNKLIKCNKKVIIVEREPDILSIFNYIELDSSWSSKWKCSRLEEKYFDKDNEAVPSVSEIYETYKKFVTDNKLKQYIIFNYNYKNHEKFKNYYKIISSNNKKILYTLKIIFANGMRDIKIPKTLDFNCDNKNVYRYITNYKDILNKNILLIGGGDTTVTYAGLLQYKNKHISIMTRNIKQLRIRFNANHKYYNFKNINNYENKFNLIHYHKINHINNNVCNYDKNMSIHFDLCFIFIGYERTIYKTNDNTIFSPYDHKITFVERLIGGKAVGQDGKIQSTANRLNLFINHICD